MRAPEQCPIVHANHFLEPACAECQLRALSALLIRTAAPTLRRAQQAPPDAPISLDFALDQVLNDITRPSPDAPGLHVAERARVRLHHNSKGLEAHRGSAASTSRTSIDTLMPTSPRARIACGCSTSTGKYSSGITVQRIVAEVP